MVWSCHSKEGVLNVVMHFEKEVEFTLLLASWKMIGDFLLDGWENSRLDTKLHVTNLCGECSVLMVMALEVQDI